MTTESLLSKPVEFPTPIESISRLDSICERLVRNISAYNKEREVLLYGFAMAETFKYQINKLEKFNSCDFSLAYVCYRACLALIDVSMKSPAEGIRLMARSLKETIDQRQSTYISLKEFIGLHFKSSILAASGYMAGTSPSPLLLEYSDFISVRHLHEFLRHGKSSVLLIDLRPKEEFDKCHLRHLELVCVDPRILVELQARCEQPTSEDLEEALKTKILDKKFKMFQNRHEYDLVVMYDRQYRQAVLNDKFKSLEIRFDQAVAMKSSPFALLIKILTERNKYLSSKLKQYPLILDGGILAWLNQYKDEGLARLPSNSSAKSESQLNGLEKTENKYVTNINDYIGNGRSMSSVSKVSNGLKRSSFGEFTLSRYNTTNEKQSGFVSSDRSKPQTALALNLGVAVPGAYKPMPPPSNTATNTMVTSYTPEKPIRTLVTQGYNTTPQKPTKSSSVLSNAVIKNNARPSTNSTLDRLTTGLVNLGNSCYMNCVLQCLVATPSLTKFFFTIAPEGNAVQLTSYKQHINKENRLGTKGVVTGALVRLIESMLQNQGLCFSPSEFKKIIGSYSPGRQFATFEQQDCIEFLNFILDSLHEDLNMASALTAKERQEVMAVSPEIERMREQSPVRLASTIEWERYLKIDFSIIVDFFQGQYLSRLKCLECRQTSTTYNVFSILSLPIPERMGSSKHVSLFDCLDFFTETELLDGDNKWHCSQCKRFTRLTKTIMITRLPAVLIIHFKRFKMAGGSGRGAGRILKLDTFIEYPVESVLDMTPYWPPAGTFLDEANTNGMSADEERQKVAMLPVRGQVAPFKYKLYGVVNHFGNLTTGHYTSYVHKKSWHYFDDSKFTPDCRPERVLNANAYCLFYQRI